jgi:hypothetical protein
VWDLDEIGEFPSRGPREGIHLEDGARPRGSRRRRHLRRMSRIPHVRRPSEDSRRRRAAAMFEHPPDPSSTARDGGGVGGGLLGPPGEISRFLRRDRARWASAFSPGGPTR